MCINEGQKQNPLTFSWLWQQVTKSSDLQGHSLTFPWPWERLKFLWLSLTLATLSADTCLWGHAAKIYCCSCGSNSCYHHPHPPEACCHWNPSHHGRALMKMVRQDRHKCSGLDGTDEEVVWNERWSKNHQQLALVPWLPCPWEAQRSPCWLEWAQRLQNLTMAHWQHVIFGDKSIFQIYLVDGIVYLVSIVLQLCV